MWSEEGRRGHVIATVTFQGQEACDINSKNGSVDEVAMEVMDSRGFRPG